jgi:hypothetical protein
MWSPLEKTVQGIIEGPTRASFTTMSFQFSMLSLDQIMDVILKGRAIIHCYYAGKSRLLVVRR